MRTLILVRGLPGAGKSTIAHSYGRMVIEADQYFLNDKGEYKFDRSKLHHAHRDCQGRVEFQMITSHHRGDEQDTIVVANTFTQEWEMKPYFELAERYGYQVSTIIVENRHGSKSVHDVPEKAVEKMRRRFEVKL